MNENDLLKILMNKIKSKDFNVIFDEYLKEYFTDCKLYRHIHQVEEFIGFSGRICEDYSGYIEPFNNVSEVISYIENGIEYNEYYNDNVLQRLYNGQKMASYCSGCGWNYPTVQDDLTECFTEYKNMIYYEFIQEYKDDIISIFNIKYDTDEEFEYNIYDDLDSSELSDYIIWDYNNILEDYTNNMTEEKVITWLKEGNKSY